MMKRRDFLRYLAASGLVLSHPELALAATKAKSLYNPTRYLFVADSESYFITIFDVVSDLQVDLLNFNIKPQVIEIARDDSMMVVGNNEITYLILYDLKTRIQRKIDLPSPLYQTFFVPQSKLVAIALRDQVGMLNYETGELTMYPERFDSARRDTHLYAYYNLLFSSFSQTYWILDEDNPRIYRKSGYDPVEKPWEVIDFSKRIQTKPGWGLDSGIASPEDYMVAFTTKEGAEGFVYFPEDDKLLSTGPMHVAGSSYRPLLLPYIDYYSKRVLFGDVSGNVALFNFDQGEKPQRFKVDFSPRLFRSGWLESTWMLGGDKGLQFQSYDNPEDKKVYRFPAQVVDMWVSGDSKTMYMVVDEGIPQVLRYDIRTKEEMDPLRIYGVVMGGQLRMGSNNSICY